MDVNLPPTDHKYELNPNIYFNNSDLFSLLSRNMDILPEEFQEILMCKEPKNTTDKESSRLSKEHSDELLKQHHLFVENNPYLATLGNNNKLHSIWRKILNQWSSDIAYVTNI